MEAEFHERTALAMQRMQAEAFKRSRFDNSMRISVMDVISAGRHEAARLLIARGDRLLDTASEKIDAARSYRQVIELFPETEHASTARERLKQLERES